jgi:hypothetical protein
VNRQKSSTTRFAVTVLVIGLVALAGAACGRHGTPAATGTPVASQIASGTGATISIEAIASAPASTATVASPSVSASASAAPSAIAATGITPAAAATPDPLDAELKALDQTVNDVNSSISGTDASSSGGE